MNLGKLWCIAAVFVATLIPFSRNASLTAFELKKYKHFLEGQGLYSDKDDVEVLTFHNFKTEVMDAPHATLVEFYNSWCGFCQRFAPSWKALASDVKNWSDLVKVAAVDCSDDDNAPVCREYEIMAYPTLRYFHEHYQEGPKNFGSDVTKGEDFAGHRHHLIDRLVTEQVEGRGRYYPNLLLYNLTSLPQLFSGAGPDVQYAFLIVDSPDSYLGAEVTLDLHKFKKFIVRYAHSNLKGLVDNLHLTKFPAIVAVDKLNNYEVFTDNNDREAIRNAIRSYLQSKNIDIGDDAPKNKDIYTGKWLEAEVPDMASLMQERARQALRERVKKIGDVVFQVDLETALRYSLKHEVASVKTITGDKLKALRDYLNVLKNYFPFGHNGHLFLNELYVAAISSDSVEGAKLGEIIVRAEQEGSRVFSSPAQWLACKGSTSSHRGYPCGLWKMFHYLTINAAEPVAHNKNADPLEVLGAMHGYIKNFFGCADCSQHFQDMALKKGMRNVSSPDSAAIWLWMAHNQVNKRLAGDLTEDPEYPKIQFPSQERCPQCKNSDGTWNLVEVPKYLKQMYSSINIRYIGSDSRILHVGLESDSSTSGSASIFKAFDMSMCFVLYVASFFLLALLIRMFLKRGYRKKPYVHDLLGKV